MTRRRARRAAPPAPAQGATEDAAADAPSPTGVLVPDAVAPPYRRLDSIDVILDELSKLFYASRYTRGVTSQKASRLAYVLKEASRLVSEKEQLAILRQAAEEIRSYHATLTGRPMLEHNPPQASEIDRLIAAQPGHVPTDGGDE